jgi:polysaccharide deacetylase 2 family uncharacterized protein YibQ
MRWLAGLLLGAIASAVEAGTAALIIDDLGNDRARARRALALPPPVAVAVLPGTPHARSVARAAHRSGFDVLVHLPMAAGASAAGSVLHDGLSEGELRRRIDDALGRLPWAIGVNNHRGSRLTRDRKQMDRVMVQLARHRRPLLFIDSRTTAASTAKAAAHAAGLGTARRHVFLDHDPSPAAVAEQVHRWLTRARVEGCALAIGHPRASTLKVLERTLARADGVERVDLRTYVERCGRSPRGSNRWHASSYPSPTARKSSKPSP